MKEFFKMFFASMFGTIVASVVVVGITIAMITVAVKSAGSKKNINRVTESSILVLETNEHLHELASDNSLAAFRNQASYSAGLFDLIQALKTAQTDDHIKGVLLKLNGSNNGWASLEQLRDALLEFRLSGKKLYAFGDGISQKDYFLASAADYIYLNPAGNMELKGLSSQLMFYKGALDKLGVQPEIFYAGRFKSATEPFRAEKMSDANRLQLTELQHDIWSLFLQAAASKAKTDTGHIQQLANVGGLYFASDALREHLIDGMKYWDEVEDMMRGLVDKKQDEKMPFVDINSYADNLEKRGKFSDSRIALLLAEGEIVDGTGTDFQIGSETLVESIRKIRRDDKIKAVVLRINSPGGSALASEIILRELELLKAKKPLIVSMGDLAASGGYYIASSADSIFAMQNTITGSIGVFGMMFNVGTALKDKLGVTFDEVKNAPLADFPTASRPLTALEASRIQSSIDTIYNTFKGHVAKGRRINREMVDSIAQGRVWTGTDAVSIGLVDAIGGIDRALRSAAAKAKLSEYRLVTYPEPVDPFRTMFRKFSSSPLSGEQIKSAISQELQENFSLYQQVQWMHRISGHAQMVMPFQPEFQ